MCNSNIFLRGLTQTSIDSLTKTLMFDHPLTTCKKIKNIDNFKTSLQNDHHLLLVPPHVPLVPVKVSDGYCIPPLDNNKERKTPTTLKPTIKDWSVLFKIIICLLPPPPSRWCHLSNSSDGCLNKVWNEESTSAGSSYKSIGKIIHL